MPALLVQETWLDRLGQFSLGALLWGDSVLPPVGEEEAAGRESAGGFCIWCTKNNLA